MESERRELFYFNGNLMIVVDISTDEELILGNPRVLFETELNTNFDVAPDGQRFVIADASTEEVAPSELVLVQNWFEELKANGTNDGR